MNKTIRYLNRDNQKVQFDFRPATAADQKEGCPPVEVVAWVYLDGQGISEYSGSSAEAVIGYLQVHTEWARPLQSQDLASTVTVRKDQS